MKLRAHKGREENEPEYFVELVECKAGVRIDLWDSRDIRLVVGWLKNDRTIDLTDTDLWSFFDRINIGRRVVVEKDGYRIADIGDNTY